MPALPSPRHLLCPETGTGSSGLRRNR